MSRSPSPPVEPPATGNLPPLRQPTDAEIVTDYLRPWLELGDHNFDRAGMGAYMPCEDMYDAAPDALTQRYPPLVSQDGQTRWYFRTPVFPKNIFNQDGRRRRTAGGGTWHDEGRVVPVVDGQRRRIGTRKLFSFKVNKTATGWLMHQFQLEALPGMVNTTALAKIYKSPLYRGPPVVPAAAANAVPNVLAAAVPDVGAAEEEDARATLPGEARAEEARVRATADAGARVRATLAEETRAATLAEKTCARSRLAEAARAHDTLPEQARARATIAEETRAAAESAKKKERVRAAAGVANEERVRAALSEPSFAEPSFAAAGVRAAAEAANEERVRAALAEPSSAAAGVRAAVPAPAANAVSSSGKRDAAAAGLAEGSSSGKRMAAEEEAPAVAVECGRCGFRLGTLRAFVSPAEL